MGEIGKTRKEGYQKNPDFSFIPVLSEDHVTEFWWKGTVSQGWHDAARCWSHAVMVLRLALTGDLKPLDIIIYEPWILLIGGSRDRSW